MSRQDLFEHLLESLHEAALNDARWPATSARLDELLETKGNGLVFGDGASRGDIDIFFAQACYRGERQHSPRRDDQEKLPEPHVLLPPSEQHQHDTETRTT